LYKNLFRDIYQIFSFFFIVEPLAGKPLCERWYSNNQLQAMLDVKKGGILKQWQHRMCILSNTRLLIYKGIACILYIYVLWQINYL